MPKIQQIELGLKELISLCHAIDKLLEDAKALTLTINEGFEKEFKFRQDYFQHKFEFAKTTEGAKSD